ncbi:MAG TPA: hypothetical protein VMP12_10950 [Candidatus Sulfotelmatobacter sp.]|nr:hypothetical protein [Candidatus Sulfotelmatobacter sp.]
MSAAGSRFGGSRVFEQAGFGRSWNGGYGQGGYGQGGYGHGGYGHGGYGRYGHGRYGYGRGWGYGHDGGLGWGRGWGWGSDGLWFLDDLFGLALNFSSLALNPWSPFASLGADLIGDGVQALGNLDNNNNYGGNYGNYGGDQGLYNAGYSNDPGYYDNSGYAYPPYRQPDQPLCGTDDSVENPGCIQ